mgnify:CR=1 FL=1
MNFTFINPPRKTNRNNLWSVIDAEMPPLGMATLAAIWEKEGHASQIIDSAALKLTIPETISKITPAPDYIGITATTTEISNATEIAQAARRAFQGTKIILGGVHPTVFHEELVRHNICDMVVRNEGEFALIALAKGTALDKVPNLTWKNEHGKIIINPVSSQFVDLDSLPFPLYEKLPMSLYHSALGAARRQPSIGMITSRGCPGKCSFCFSEMFGVKIRFMSPERIVEHILLLNRKYGIREISFYDDTFTADQNRIAALCQMLLNRKLKISWSCFARVDTVTPELLLLMKKAGCHQVMYGFETSDETILDRFNKRVNLEQARNAIRWTKAAKINIRGAFMLGSPEETAESMQKTIEFAKKSGIQLAIFNVTTPYPGTPLYREFSSRNALLHHNWDLYNRAELVLKLDTLTAEDVKYFYYKSYREFYLRPVFIIKYILNIRTLTEISILVKALFKIIRLTFKRLFHKQL